MSPFCQPVLVTMPPPLSLNRDGTAGILLPGLVAYDLTREAGVELARRLLTTFGAGHGPWRTGQCRRCGSGPRPVRTTGGRMEGLCAGCVRKGGA